MAEPMGADATFNRYVWQYWCINTISYRWDQWMACTITCSHGRYRAFSNGLGDAMGQSLSRAFAAFLADDVKHGRDEDDDDD